MLKLAQDNSIIIQVYLELRKDFDISSSKFKCAYNDLSIEDIVENGFIMLSEAERNRDFMTRSSLKYMKVEKNGLKWILQHEDPEKKLGL